MPQIIGAHCQTRHGIGLQLKATRPKVERSGLQCGQVCPHGGNSLHTRQGEHAVWGTGVHWSGPSSTATRRAIGLYTMYSVHSYLFSVILNKVILQSIFLSIAILLYLWPFSLCTFCAHSTLRATHTSSSTT